MMKKIFFWQTFVLPGHIYKDLLVGSSLSSRMTVTVIRHRLRAVGGESEKSILKVSLRRQNARFGEQCARPVRGLYPVHDWKLAASVDTRDEQPASYGDHRNFFRIFTLKIYILIFLVFGPGNVPGTERTFNCFQKMTTIKFYYLLMPRFLQFSGFPSKPKLLNDEDVASEGRYILLRHISIGRSSCNGFDFILITLF